MQQNLQSERFHSLDAARAIALLIGIFHHGIESLVSYVKGDWITQDSQESILIDILFYVSHVFRMHAFFLMSGFFASLLINKRGLRGFAVNRFLRLVVPLVLFWPILYFSIYAMWVWGIEYLKHVTHEEAIKQVPTYMLMDYGFPLMHLWFLYFLIIYCAIVILLESGVKWIDPQAKIRLAIDRFLSAVMIRWSGGLVLGLFMVFPMWGMTDWFGVDTSESGLLPRLFPFIIYGMYFTIGWFLHRQEGLILNMSKFRQVNLMLCMILISIIILLSLLFSHPPKDIARFVLAGLNTLYAFASMTAVFAFLGYMQILFERPNSKIRYLSGGAYWGYLIHIPIIGFCQIIIAPFDWFWGLKLAVVFIPTLVTLFISYQYGVRKTWIGVLLNGRRDRS